jgi:hypothetical protein
MLVRAVRRVWQRSPPRGRAVRDKGLKATTHPFTG